MATRGVRPLFRKYPAKGVGIVGAVGDERDFSGSKIDPRPDVQLRRTGEAASAGHASAEAVSGDVHPMQAVAEQVDDASEGASAFGSNTLE